MEQPKQNKDFVNKSLVNQIAEFSIKVAERDALITELSLKIEGQNKELEDYRKKETEEMDGAE